MGRKADKPSPAKPARIMNNTLRIAQAEFHIHAQVLHLFMLLISRHHPRN